MRIVGFIVFIWLIIGAIAVWQRGYFEEQNDSCAGVGTIVVTVLAGPLNYAGVNPVVHNCNLPEPSQ
jgi:hypothetical protein